MKKGLLFVLICMMFAGCARGWDDDSQYAIRTRAVFFTSPAQSTVGLSLIRYADGIVTRDWNETAAGIRTVDLSDVDMRDNALWLANTTGRSVHQINPEDGTQLQFIAGLPIMPHYIAVGRDQLMAADTVEDRIVFVRLRNGKVTEANVDGKPGICMYQNGRFFLRVDATQIHIYDEKAMTPRAKLEVSKPVIELQTDRYNTIRLFCKEDSAYYFASISGNADDFIEINGADVFWNAAFRKIRYTPYFDPRFGTEYLQDLRLRDSIVETAQGQAFTNRAENFEVDFFEGQLFYTDAGMLYRFDLNSMELVDSVSFSGEMRRAFFQYGGE